MSNNKRNKVRADGVAQYTDQHLTSAPDAPTPSVTPETPVTVTGLATAPQPVQDNTAVMIGGRVITGTAVVKYGNTRLKLFVERKGPDTKPRLEIAVPKVGMRPHQIDYLCASNDAGIVKLGFASGKVSNQIAQYIADYGPAFQEMGANPESRKLLRGERKAAQPLEQFTIPTK